jgi:F-type H+-transporting ATPase subunit delta
MQGASRRALTESRQALNAQIDSGAEPAALGDELLAIAQVLTSSPPLRRALSDPSAEPADRVGLQDRLFAGKVSESAQRVLRTAVGRRWSDEHDLGDSLERLGAEAILTAADRAGRLDEIEDQLFRFERAIAGDHGLSDALSDPRRSGADKAQLVTTLLEGKAAPETVRLARQAASNPGGLPVRRQLDSYVALAAELRHRLAATVTSAVELTESERSRLAESLSRIYGRTVHLNTVVDPSIIGGLRVQVGGEVIDGTIATRLEDARRTMTG